MQALPQMIEPQADGGHKLTTLLHEPDSPAPTGLVSRLEITRISDALEYLVAAVQGFYATQAVFPWSISDCCCHVDTERQRVSFGAVAAWAALMESGKEREAIDLVTDEDFYSAAKALNTSNIELFGFMEAFDWLGNGSCFKHAARMLGTVRGENGLCRYLGAKLREDDAGSEDGAKAWVEKAWEVVREIRKKN